METGRYSANRVPVEEGLCETSKVVKDEYHALLYADLRTQCLDDIYILCDDFPHIPQKQHFLRLLRFV